MPTIFNLLETPIEKGSTLIEASAGTGKTHAISRLFFRLLIEHKAAVSEILVVTFTQAATAELRDRIRDLLSRARKSLATGEPDAKVSDVVELILRQPNPASAFADLEAALRTFDQAAIFTIHGFCQRMLKEKAFESGSLFDIELVTDQHAILQEVADDYWRRQFYESISAGVAVALGKGWSPDRLLPLLECHVRHPSLEVLTSGRFRGLAAAEAELESVLNELRVLWRDEAAAIRGLFGAGAKWAVDPYNNEAKMAEKFLDMDACLSAASLPVEFVACFAEFCPKALQAKLSKRWKSGAPAHRFFDLCQRFCDAQNEFVIALQADFCNFARGELDRRKHRLKVQSFDDLLTRMNDALGGPGGGELADYAGRAYKAALIDEFQDTDPIQHGIFQRLFGSDAHWLFLIGDPKQAIFGFRGADIFTYMQAARNATRRYTLQENWRSESGLVAAVNTVFSHAARPFVFDEIEFHPARARGAADQEPLTIESRRKPPLELWFWRRSEGEGRITRKQIRERLPGIVAAEIARLLNGETRIGGRKLVPENIAVLVMTHDQARQMQRALHDVRIPSVLHAIDNLFESHESGELQTVLTAIARPSNERLLRAALATDMLGLSAGELDRLAHDEGGWQERLERFRDYHDLWRQAGFIQMFRKLLQREEVRPRLLAFPDGERRLTNLLHLGEALHQGAVEERLGIPGVLKWLAAHRAPSDQPPDEYQLRLERDENAVRLVTVFKSKGLEYDVVFCPFSWRASNLKNWRTGEDEVLFHRDDATVVRDLGSDHYEANHERAMTERLADNTRLFYVALTRARHRCYFVWGAVHEAETSAPSWIFHPPRDLSAGIIPALREHFPGLTDEILLRELEGIAACSRNGSGEAAIAIEDLPEASASPYRPAASEEKALSARRFAGVIPRDWRISSFSSLTAGQEADLPDRDATEAVAPSVQALAKLEFQEVDESGIAGFPRGPKAGTCLHEIFEQLDFTAGDPEALARHVAGTLSAHGFLDPRHPPVITRMVEDVLRVPLEPGRPEFTLSSILPSARMNEFEFHFPLKKISPHSLRAAFAGARGGPLPENFPERLGRLTFSPAGGFMKGFIDLVFEFDGRFHIADWKSNWLGNEPGRYDADALRVAMAEHCYPLQYHLYTLALDRYLELRVPGYDYETHFGGVFYIFLRGVDPARPDFGIYRDRPSFELVRRLREGLCEERLHVDARE